ncbi:MAG: polysaccharide biosynthesis tyrosine autokinase, partial [Pedobacter sp.]
MATLQGQLTTFTIPEKNNHFEIGSVIKKYLFHWPLFLICFLIFMPLAFYYAKTTPPYYEIKASLLIKDDKKNQDKQVSALHEIDLINSAKVIENEIEILKSRKLITSVVEDLNLWISYQTKDEYKTIDLYETSPVKFVSIKQNESFENQVFKVTIVNEKTFDLLMKDGRLKRYNFNQAYTDVVGNWKLEPFKNFKKNFGKTVIISVTNPEIVATQYQRDIDASLSNKLSSTVVLTVNDRIAERGKAILNGLLTNYNLGTTNEKDKDLKNTIDFLDKKIAELAGDLGTSEKGIENFKSSKGLTDISMQSKVSLENLQANDNKLNEANIQLDIINRIDTYVNSAQNSDKVPSANGITDDGLASLIEKLSKLQLEYQQLAANTPETSPEFDPINRQIKTTRSSIKESVKNIKASLQSKRDRFQSLGSNFETSIKNIPTQEREYINIKREQSSKESLYTYYLQKREEASANYAAILTDDKIIDQAYAGLPKGGGKIAYACAMLLALALPTGLIYGRTLLGNKILKTTDISHIIDNQIIAEIPLGPSKKTIAVSDKFSTPTSEQFRALRTRLHYLHKDREKGRVTLVTSSIPGEGKSFISANLSISLAYTERKVIILELDMRKPKIADAFSLPNEQLGLSDYFLGNVAIDAIIQQSSITSNLDVISSGTLILNPSELLERKELRILITELRKIYDDIIIDSPPVHLVPDATIVSPLTDVCLYVIRQGFTNKTELVFLNTLLEQNQLLNTNIVFNGLKKQKYGYGYS